MEAILVLGLIWFAVSVPVALIIGRAMRRGAAGPQPEVVQPITTEAAELTTLASANSH